MTDLANYLARLTFDQNLWKSIHAKYLTNVRLVIMFILGIVVIGTVNYLAIPRRLNPEIQIPIITVSTLLPGATPGDVEQLITTPLEDKLKSLKNVDAMTSTSRDNVSVIVIQFLSTVKTEDARTEVQQSVDTVTDLPKEAETPVVNTVDFENQPVWTFAMTGSDVPSLMRAATALKKELESVSKIDRVAIAGVDKERIIVTLDPAKTAQYGVSPLLLSQALSTGTKSLPAGSVKTTASTFSLSLDPSVGTIDDIRAIRLTIPTGAVVSLGDIARVERAAEYDQPHTYYADPQSKTRPAIEFFVYKTKTSNIDAAADAAIQTTDDFLGRTNGQFKIVTIENTGTLIDEQFADLISEFRSTIILIFIILTLFLGIKQAVIASFTVPLTLLSGIAVANIMGLTLNFLTLFAFLLALGLLIDDTIVIVTAMTRYYGTGKFTPAETGILVWRDFIVPIWSTTIATIWSFLPLLLATGIIGEFIKPIPIIVTATMISSTSIAVLITIPLMIIFLKPQLPRRVRILLIGAGGLILGIGAYTLLPRSPLTVPIIGLMYLSAWYMFRIRTLIFERVLQIGRQFPRITHAYSYLKQTVSKGYIDTERMSRFYMRILKKILASRHGRRNTIIFIIVFALVSYALVPLGLVKNEFFPKTNEDAVYVSLELPAGSTLNATNQQTLSLMEQLKKTPYARFVIGETGSTLNADFQRNTASNNALFTLYLGKPATRTLSSIDIAETLRAKYASYSGGTITVIERSGGPPAGADIQIKLLGDDLAVLDVYAKKIQQYLHTQAGVTNIATSVKTGTSKIVFQPDETKMATEEVSRDMLGFWLRTYASGFTLDSIRLNEDPTKKIDVIFQLSQHTISPEALSQLTIQKPGGGSVPIMNLGTLTLKNNPTIINHEDTKRTLSVTAGVVKGYTASEINQKLEQFAKTKLNLPRGYEWKTGGANEENQKSVNSILQAMILSFLLILVTMILEFNSFRQAAIVMFTIPLAVSGVFYIFGLTGTPLSFPALIGILALFGIVVTNAIVVVEKINSNIREGMDTTDAIVDASGSRLEPVLLTSLSTIFGLLPITIADPLWRGLGGAIISGLFFSGMIKLIFIPIMYYNWFGKPSQSNG